MDKKEKKIRKRRNVWGGKLRCGKDWVYYRQQLEASTQNMLHGPAALASSGSK